MSKVIEISKGIYGVEVYRSECLNDDDFYNDVLNKLHVDVRNHSDYLVLGDNDSFEFSGSVRVVYKVFGVPILSSFSLSNYIFDDIVMSDDSSQDLLDGFYGNKKKLKEYRIRYERFISHLIDEDGKKSIKDYSLKAEDESFLHLEEFSFRLERLSNAEFGDFSLYDEVIDLYHLIGTVPKDYDGREFSNDEIVKLLRVEDCDYIESNNCSFKKKNSIYDNLIMFENLIQNDNLNIDFISSLVNAGVLLDCFVKKPLYCFKNREISDVNSILCCSKKNAMRVYSNSFIYRYRLRKNIFGQFFYLNFMMNNQKRMLQGKRIVNIDSFWCSVQGGFISWYDAFFKAKWGNDFLLKIKENDYKLFGIYNNYLKIQRDDINSKLCSERELLLKTIECLKEDLDCFRDEGIIKGLIFVKNKMLERLLDVEKNISINSKIPILGVAPVDSISIEQYKNCNNSLRNVIGVAKVSDVDAISYSGTKISKVVFDKIRKKECIPGNEYVLRVWKFDELSYDDLERLTIKDILNFKNKNISFLDNTAEENGDISSKFLRGVSFYRYGNKFSGFDGVDYGAFSNDDYDRFSFGCQIDVFDENSKLFEVIAQTISRQTFEVVTANQLINEFICSIHSKVAIRQMIDNFKLLISSNSEGVDDMYWDDSIDLYSFISSSFIQGHYENINRVTSDAFVDVISLDAQKDVDFKIIGALIENDVNCVNNLYDLLKKERFIEENSD